MNTVNAEMISRAIKWIFRNYLQKADQSVTGQAVAHLLNCLFASCPVQLPQINDDINGNPDKVLLQSSKLQKHLSQLKFSSTSSNSAEASSIAAQLAQFNFNHTNLVKQEKEEG